MEKLTWKFVEKKEKNCFAVRMEWVKLKSWIIETDSFFGH